MGVRARARTLRGRKPTPQHAFDSTLGYPGEGPATLMGWNADGLNDLNKFGRALRAAKRLDVDAILIQENNWPEGKPLEAAKFRARTCGWTLHSVGRGPLRKGGTAIVTRDSSTEVDHTTHFTLRYALRHEDGSDGQGAADSASPLAARTNIESMMIESKRCKCSQAKPEHWICNSYVCVLG